jgi:hypothetical protein
MHATRVLGRLGLRAGASRLWGIAALCGLLATLAFAAVGPSPALAAAKSYKVCTETADWTNAGTDGDVHVMLYGTHGITKWLELDSSNDDFERGHEDCFTFTFPHLGTIYQVGVKIDCDECWALNRITTDGRSYGWYGWVPEEGLLLPSD